MTVKYSHGSGNNWEFKVDSQAESGDAHWQWWESVETWKIPLSPQWHTSSKKRPHLLILSKYFHQLGTNILIYEGCAHSNHHTLSSETSVDTLRASLHVSSSSSPPLSGSANVYLQCAGSMACRNPMWVNFHSPWWQAAYSWDKMLHSELSNLIPSLLCL